MQSQPYHYIRRLEVVPLSVRGAPVRTVWFMQGGVFAGALGFWGLATPPHSVWGFFLLAPGLLALIAGVALRRKRYVRVQGLCNLEANADGHVFYTRIGGECPVCDGELAVGEVRRPGGRGKMTVCQCSRDPSHVWAFDAKVLPDL